MTEMDKTLLVLAGPTAIGKTACGIHLASHFNTEIISADSRQIYRETTIGTAVPTPEELRLVKHHLIQTASLEEPYHASRYEQEALRVLEVLFKEHNLVLMVGGSGLYIDGLCNGIDDLPPADPKLRAQLLEQFRLEGLEPLAGQLKGLDPLSYTRIDLKNHMRVLKALEVSIQTGKPYSSFLSAPKKERPFRILRVALDMEREVLYQRINQRVDLMMQRGLLDEVRSVIRFRYLTAMKTVGYRELFRHLDGEISLEEAVDLIKRNTRKFARKQLTWFRKGNRYQWFHPEKPAEIIGWIEQQLDYL
ncbi:MAG: tRNA (adenosine(37)-N6)-dimethylallyltransferase MiaA [Bacteroidales bacterium]